ncbi:hypothetical protein L2E82_29345 [Cichorium intybus]|uniref:Uncharacterized protein n=1 Tax=Cichorium intybus TaxID=13427 RepID=A0ACB9CXW5_CICIN|nr:hypothetical protein L2E82_29345 [Cichorium intybus]
MLRQFKELGLEPVIGGDWILLPWPIIMALIGILCYFVSDLSTPKRRGLLLRMSAVRFFRSVVILLARQLKETLFLPAMSVHFQFAGPAMNTNGRMAINLLLNVKLDTSEDTSDLKVLIYIFPDFSYLHRYPSHIPAIPGDKEDDVGTDEETTTFPFSSQTQSEKQKTAERMLRWHMTYGRGEDTNTPNYDKEKPSQSSCKQDSISSLLSAYRDGSSSLLKKQVLEKAGSFIRISSAADSLIWRVEVKVMLESEMGEFTGILHSKKPDNLMDEIPTFVVDPLPSGLDRGYIVLNRPWEFVQWLERATIAEEFVLMAKLDDIFVNALPNLAHGEYPAGFPFFYIKPDQNEKMIRKYYPKEYGPVTNVDPIGNSPVIIRKDLLEKIALTWMNVSLRMQDDPVTDRTFGWLCVTYAYAMASALHGVHHILRKDFMIQAMKVVKLVKLKEEFDYESLCYKLENQKQTIKIKSRQYIKIGELSQGVSK